MDLVKLCLDSGASNAEKIITEKLVFQPELRAACEQNSCGKYGRNYACPPFTGDIDSLISTIREYPFSVIFQTIFKLEDSFDFEGMMLGQEKHNSMSREIAKKAYAEYGRDNVLALTAGGCKLCEKCGAETNEPCRHPKDVLASMEAYGLNVSKISEVSGLKYINGVNTVTYFSGLFLK